MALLERIVREGGDEYLFDELMREPAAAAGKEAKSEAVVPQVSQETLAEMVGTTRSRVNFFMNKFRKLGFIDYNGGLEVNSSLLSVVLHE